MRIKTNVVGEHNGEEFALVDGLLSIFGTRVSRSGIKTIVEIATLLEAQGYKMRERFPKYKPQSFIDQLHGTLPDIIEDDSDETEKNQ